MLIILLISPGFAAGGPADGLAGGGRLASDFPVWAAVGGIAARLPSLGVALEVAAGGVPPTTVALEMFGGGAPSFMFFTRIEIRRFEGS